MTAAILACSKSNPGILSATIVMFSPRSESMRERWRLRIFLLLIPLQLAALTADAAAHGMLLLK